MAKVTVRLYTTLKEIARLSRIEVEADNMQTALDLAVSKFGAKFASTLYDQEKSKDGKKIVHNCFNLVVNSEMVGLKNLERKELKDGDMIHIFPPIAGGVEVENG